MIPYEQEFYFDDFYNPSFELLDDLLYLKELAPIRYGGIISLLKMICFDYNVKDFQDLYSLIQKTYSLCLYYDDPRIDQINELLDEIFA